MIFVSPAVKIGLQNKKNTSDQNRLTMAKSTDTTVNFADCLTAATAEILASLTTYTEDERHENFNFKKKAGGK